MNTYHCCVEVTYNRWVWVDAEDRLEAERAAKTKAGEMHPEGLEFSHSVVDTINDDGLKTPMSDHKFVIEPPDENKELYEI